MGAFLTGLASSDLGSSIMERIKGRKKLKYTGKVRAYNPSTGTVGPPTADRNPVSNGYGRPTLGSYKKGGKVRKTGKYKLHAGERVLTKRQARKYRGGRRGKRR